MYYFTSIDDDDEAIGPGSYVKGYDGAEDILTSMVLSTDNLIFNSDGSLTIIFHGIKNDYDRNGFEVNLPKASHPRLDPAKALQCYLQRTKYIRPKSKAVFLSLKAPYGAISATGVARILDRAIVEAGLDGQGFSAKHFRPTAATVALEKGVAADTVRKIGRWKSRETFEAHYVHAFPVLSFTDKVLNISD